MRPARHISVGFLLAALVGCGAVPSATVSATPKASATAKPAASLATLRVAYKNLLKPVAAATCRQNQTIAKGPDLATGRSVAAQFVKGAALVLDGG